MVLLDINTSRVIWDSYNPTGHSRLKGQSSSQNQTFVISLLTNGGTCCAEWWWGISSWQKLNRVAVPAYYPLHVCYLQKHLEKHQTKKQRMGVRPKWLREISKNYILASFYPKMSQFTTFFTQKIIFFFCLALYHCIRALQDLHEDLLRHYCNFGLNEKAYVLCFQYLCILLLQWH